MIEKLIRKLFFPSVNFTSHKRMKFAKYIRTGDVKTIDVACGGGSFAVVAAQKGNRVLGVDYDQSNIDLARRYIGIFALDPHRIRFEQRDIKTLAAIGETFEQVICFEILEHIMDDDRIVGHISKITSPGARLLVSVPNLHHKPMYKEDVSPVENGDHVRFGYSFEQLESLLGKHGFKVKQRDSCAGLATQWATSVEAYLADKLFSPKPMPRWISMALFTMLSPVTFLDAAVGGEDLSIFVLAEKESVSQKPIAG